MRRAPPPLGLTLVEVVIALFIFSVISILGAQAIDGLTRSSLWVEKRHFQHRELLIFMRHAESDIARSMGDIRVVRGPNNKVIWEFPTTYARYELHSSGEIKRFVEEPGLPVRELSYGLVFDALTLQVHQSGQWIDFERRVPADFNRAFKVSFSVRGLDDTLSMVTIIEPNGI